MPTYNSTNWCSGMLPFTRSLLTASKELGSRGLILSSRWALELLGGLSKVCSSGVENVVGQQLVLTNIASEEEECVFSLARAYLENREFARVAHCLDGHYLRRAGALSSQTYPPKPFFLRCYALYLVRFSLFCVNLGKTVN